MLATGAAVVIALRLIGHDGLRPTLLVLIGLVVVAAKVQASTSAMSS